MPTISVSEQSTNSSSRGVLAATNSQVEASETESEITSDFDSQVITKLIRSNVYKDKWNLVYFIFLIFGISGTIPWNFFITAEQYWQYKLRTLNESGAVDPSTRNEMQTKFASYLSLASMIPGMLGLLLCTALKNRILLHVRIFGPFIIILVLFIPTLVLTTVDTNSWQTGFLFATLGTMAVMSGFISFGQASCFGVAGTIHPRFVRAIMNGQAICGILASVATIVTIAAGTNETSFAFYFFIIAIVLIVMNMVAYVVLQNCKFYKSHKRNAEAELSQINDMSEPSLKTSLISVISQIKVHAVSVILVFIVTLSVYPAVAVLVISVNRNSNSPWTNMYFLPFACFLLFNVGDFAGRCVSNWIRVVPVTGIILPIICALRIVYIPLFLLCNAHPRHHLPVLLDSDLSFIILIGTFSVSNGYLASHCMMHAPKTVKLELQELAGITMTLCMAIGITLGTFISYFILDIL